MPLEVVLGPLALGIRATAGEKVSALDISKQRVVYYGRGMASPGTTGEKPSRGYAWSLLLSSGKAFEAF